MRTPTPPEVMSSSWTVEDSYSSIIVIEACAVVRLLDLDMSEAADFLSRNESVIIDEMIKSGTAAVERIVSVERISRRKQ